MEINEILEQKIELQRTLEDWNKPFDWSLYNKSQTREKVMFLRIQKELLRRDSQR